ncbi:MAG: hypothetical protein IJ756_01500 [Paludibacteraceae bacterium]|nr:hypothetical protein [Paludibacteraceae bacterium]MBR1785823.1 hypothetical protein [Paludibacteraceae bacterium]
MKTVIRLLLGVSICFLAYICVMSLVTPIKFENTREARQDAVVKNLVHLRTAELEFFNQNKRYTDDLDSLVLFLRTAKKAEVFKQGSLTDKQLEAGLTEQKAAKIIETAKQKALKNKKLTFENEDELYAYIRQNDADIKKYNLQDFRRDTVYVPLIPAVYKEALDSVSVGDIVYIPYTDKVKYEVSVNNEFVSKGAPHPVFEIRAPYSIYLADLDEQELVNLIDKEEKLEHFPGLKVGSVTEPTTAGNWE